MKKIIFLLILIPAVSFGQKVNTLPVVPGVKDSDLVVIQKKDSGINKTLYRVYGITLKNYLAVPNMPQVLFNHYLPAYNSGTTETILYNDSIPGGTLTTSGYKVKAEYIGSDSANHSDTTYVYFQGNLLCKLNYATGQAWRYDIFIMATGAGTITWEVWSDFPSGSSGAVTLPAELNGTITGLTLTKNNSLKITGRSTSGSRQIQAKMGTIYFYP